MHDARGLADRYSSGRADAAGFESESPAARWIADWDDVRPESSRGFVRLARAGEWEAGCRRVPFEAMEDATETAEHLVTDAAAAQALRSICQLTGSRLISWTAGQLYSGDLRLLWRPRAQQVYAPVEIAAPPPAPVPRHRPAPSGPSPAYATFPPDFDAVAVAQSLKSAAQDGVPFCEECRKAQEAASGETA